MDISVGSMMPPFSCCSIRPDGVIMDISLNDFRGQYGIIFFYSQDWTSEAVRDIQKYSKLLQKIRNYNCAVVGVSVDSIHSHENWLRALSIENITRGRTLSEKSISENEISCILMSDSNRALSESLNMMYDHKRYAIPGWFLMNPEGIIIGRKKINYQRNVTISEQLNSCEETAEIILSLLNESS